MCVGVNRLNYQSSGQEVRWECPRGHEEADDTPLLARAYCVECGRDYEWSQVTQLGPVRAQQRVAMPEALVR